MKKQYPKYLSLRKLILDSAEKYGDKVYLKYINNDKSVGEITFKKFASYVESLATYLENQNSISRIAILSENRYEWILTYVSAVSSGRVIVPLDKELEFNQAISFMDISNSDTLFFSAAFLPQVREFAQTDCKIKRFICFDKLIDNTDSRFTDFSSCITKGDALIADGDMSFKKLRTDSGRMAAIIFTSGTTGTSKGVMLSEENILSCVYSSANMVKISFDDTVLSVLPYHHTYETSCGLLTPICLGTTVCINNSLKYVIKNMKLFRPTAIVLVPLFVTTIYKKIESEIKKQNKEKLVKNSIALTKTVRHIGIDLRRIAFAKIHETLGGRLHTIICGGAALDPQYIEKFEDLGIAVYQGYGITECAPLVSVMPYYAKIKKTSVGIPISGSIIKIIGFDDNDGDEIDMDTGEIGEICVKGPHVMLGYYNNEAATAATFSKEGFFKTGDYGYVDDEGYIYITGRKKNIIIFDNGKNIYPEEIEEYLLRCDLICECAVIARVLDGEELLTAVVYPDYEKFLGRSDIEIKDEIKQAIMGINKTLPSFKQIRNIEIKKTEFEKTSSKKIIRYKI